MKVLHDIATTMPSQTWLTSYSSSRTGGATTAPTGPVIVGGQFTVAGKGFDHPDAADWLARISQIREVVGLWLSHRFMGPFMGCRQRSLAERTESH